MKSILISLDPHTARRLEEVAPARSHKRSAFIRAAIVKALDAIVEERMAEAYQRRPQAEDDFPFDPDAWEKEPWSDADVIADSPAGRAAGLPIPVGALRAAERRGGGYGARAATNSTPGRGRKATRSKRGKRS